MADGDSARRPGSVVVRRFQWSSCVVTQWRGWRAKSIDRTLDMLAAIEGGFYDEVYGPRLGQMSEAEALKAAQRAARRNYTRRNAELYRANSIKQAAVWRARVRLEWDSYCRLYRSRFPGTEPVGFDRWSKTLFKRWQAEPESVMFLNRMSRQSVREVVDRLDAQVFRPKDRGSEGGR